jgi:protein-S-isoprenylcysteine O-methyltransferase Ste14
MKTRDVILAVLVTIIAVGQIVLAILLYADDANTAVRNTGWGILWVSAIFGWLPVITLKRWGDVPKGKSYVHTTQVVDRGIYSIVRHPQYLAGILMGIALALITQHWIVGVFGAAAVVVYYASTFDEEQRALDKFGDDYSRYAQKVPRLNCLLGIARAVRRRATN